MWLLNSWLEPGTRVPSSIEPNLVRRAAALRGDTGRRCELGRRHFAVIDRPGDRIVGAAGHIGTSNGGCRRIGSGGITRE